MFANSTSSTSWPISTSDFFQFRLWIFCQLNPTGFLLFSALSRVCWVPAQCQFWNTDFLPGSVGQMLLCQVFLFCFVFCGFLPLYLQWPMVSIMFWCPLMQSATCPTVPWLTSLCSNVFVIVLFGLEVPYRKLVTLFIFDYWEKSHKSLNPKKKIHLVIFSVVFFVFKGYLKVKKLKDIFLGCLLCLRCLFFSFLLI